MSDQYPTVDSVYEDHSAISSFGTLWECDCGWEPDRNVRGGNMWVQWRAHVNDVRLEHGHPPTRPETLVEIKTVEQLRALPDGAVILTKMNVFHRLGDFWYSPGDELPDYSPEAVGALLIWHPAWEEA